MPIRVTCDECASAFDAPDDGADGLAPCPKCGAACLVPVPGALPPLLAEAIEPDDPAPQNRWHARRFVSFGTNGSSSVEGAYS